MKHNGGLLFRKFQKINMNLKQSYKENHLNRVKITHGGYLASIIDAGAWNSSYIDVRAKCSMCYNIFRYKIYSTIKGLDDEIIGMLQKF